MAFTLQWPIVISNSERPPPPVSSYHYYCSFYCSWSSPHPPHHHPPHPDPHPHPQHRRRHHHNHPSPNPPPPPLLLSHLSHPSLPVQLRALKVCAVQDFKLNLLFLPRGYLNETEINNIRSRDSPHQAHVDDSLLGDFRLGGIELRDLVVHNHCPPLIGLV